MRRGRIKLLVSFVAIAIVVISSIAGVRREAGEVKDYVADIIPENCYAESSGEMRFGIYSNDTDILNSYIVIEESKGYGGKMVMAVLIDTAGVVRNLKILKHTETPSFLKKVTRKGIFNDLLGKQYSDQFETGIDIDIASGATYTSEAIISCARRGSRVIADKELGFEVPPEKVVRFSIGIPEITLVILYLIAFAGIYTRFRYRKQLRWLTLTAGMVIIGFWFAVPLSLSKINTLLLGYWPDWHTELYWYLMIFGFILTIILTRKNIYCNWICPVGCIQDGLGAIGAAKHRFSKKINLITTWISRSIAWIAIVLALYFRNPAKLNYEIFGVSVSLTGATYLFAITAIFFIVSLFIKRPWCKYLCPITPFADLVRLLSIRRKDNQEVIDDVH